MRLRDLRRACADKLRPACGDSAAYDADLLIEKAYGISRGELITKLDTGLDQGTVEPLIERRISGEPTQYILGEWEFYGLPFYVGEGVLIPRQDTEISVERALSLIKDIRSPHVLELCSGSGCIAVAIASARPDARVTAVELYDDALRYLRRNVERNAVGVEIRKADVLKAPSEFGKYDLIISNPPYINDADMSALPREVRREPQTALAGGEDGLDFYRAIARLWLPLVERGGAVTVEIGYDQGDAVRDIFISSGVDAVCEKDYSGLDRVIYGTVK